MHLWFLFKINFKVLSGYQNMFYSSSFSVFNQISLVSCQNNKVYHHSTFTIVLVINRNKQHKIYKENIHSFVLAMSEYSWKIRL